MLEELPEVVSHFLDVRVTWVVGKDEGCSLVFCSLVRDFRFWLEELGSWDRVCFGRVMPEEVEGVSSIYVVICQFLAHLAKGPMSYCHGAVSVVRPSTIRENRYFS